MHASIGLTEEKREPFVHRYLDPASRLGEVLFGLIMVLTITLTAGLTAEDGRAGVRQLLFAAIGCNIAWGLIDAVMYVMNCVTERVGKIHLVEAVQGAKTPEEAIALIKEDIDPDLSQMLTAENADALSRAMFTHISSARPAAKGITRDDIFGAIACFWLVFVSCLPAAIPFFIFRQPHLALRISNFLLIALLFLVGKKWGAYAHLNPFATGFTMVAIGLLLVGAAVLLGG